VHTKDIRLPNCPKIVVFAGPYDLTRLKLPWIRPLLPGRRKAYHCRVHWDGFAEIERDVRAMVADPRWAGLPMLTRTEAMTQRTLMTPDGSRWLFGAHARWYRLDRVDGRWHLSAPPLDAGIRSASRPMPPGLGIAHPLIPSGPDFAFERGSTQAFVGPDVPSDVTERIRALVVAQRGLPRENFPLTGFREVFAEEVAGTVAAVWGTIMWCAYAPAFD
jgi:hypothetical protein